MIQMVYIVICEKGGGDFSHYIDSVWTSERKAIKRQEELNSANKRKWRNRYSYGLFEIEQKGISK